jgi:hypothetical protein
MMARREPKTKKSDLRFARHHTVTRAVSIIEVISIQTETNSPNRSLLTQ